MLDADSKPDEPPRSVQLVLGLIYASEEAGQKFE